MIWGLTLLLLGRVYGGQCLSCSDGLPDIERDSKQERSAKQICVVKESGVVNCSCLTSEMKSHAEEKRADVTSERLKNLGDYFLGRFLDYSKTMEGIGAEAEVSGVSSASLSALGERCSPLMISENLGCTPSAKRLNDLFPQDRELVQKGLSALLFDKRPEMSSCQLPVSTIQALHLVGSLNNDIDQSADPTEILSKFQRMNSPIINEILTSSVMRSELKRSLESMDKSSSAIMSTIKKISSEHQADLLNGFYKKCDEFKKLASTVFCSDSSLVDSKAFKAKYDPKSGADKVVTTSETLDCVDQEHGEMVDLQVDEKLGASITAADVKDDYITLLKGNTTTNYCNALNCNPIEKAKERGAKCVAPTPPEKSRTIVELLTVLGCGGAMSSPLCGVEPFNTFAIYQSLMPTAEKRKSDLIAKYKSEGREPPKDLDKIDFNQGAFASTFWSKNRLDLPVTNDQSKGESGASATPTKGAGSDSGVGGLPPVAPAAAVAAPAAAPVNANQLRAPESSSPSALEVQPTPAPSSSTPKSPQPDSTFNAKEMADLLGGLIGKEGGKESKAAAKKAVTSGKSDHRELGEAATDEEQGATGEDGTVKGRQKSSRGVESFEDENLRTPKPNVLPTTAAPTIGGQIGVAGSESGAKSVAAGGVSSGAAAGVGSASGDSGKIPTVDVPKSSKPTDLNTDLLKGVVDPSKEYILNIITSSGVVVAVEVKPPATPNMSGMMKLKKINLMAYNEALLKLTKSPLFSDYFNKGVGQKFADEVKEIPTVKTEDLKGLLKGVR